MSGISDEKVLRDQMARLVEVLERALGRTSRWTGEVFIASGYAFSGIAHYDGSISLNEVVNADSDMRWRTMIHEALHTFSPTYMRSEYVAARGWEEGVVEQLQRLMRRKVLGTLRVLVSEKAIAAVEQDHPYNAYIASLEDLRVRLSESEDRFYRILLATPVVDRAVSVKQMGEMLTASEKRAFNLAFLKAVRVLSQ